MRYKTFIRHLLMWITIASSLSACSGDDSDDGEPVGSASGSITINGHQGVLMRRATENSPALYVATCNIGATKPEEAGKYFFWGDTEGKDGKGYKSPKSFYTYDKSIEVLHKKGYITTNDVSTSVLKPEYDAAHIQWGGDWRMPTKEELIWLKDNCIWMWQSSRDGKLAGYKVQSKKTNNTIFIPAAGLGKNDRIKYLDDDLYIWSASPCEKSTESWNLEKTDMSFKVSNLERDIQLQIRPVASEP